MKRIHSNSAISAVLGIGAMCGWSLVSFDAKAQTSATPANQALQTALEQAVLTCEREEYDTALPELARIAESTKGMAARLYYATCLQKSGKWVEARRNCELAYEQAQIAEISAQTKEEARLAKERQKEARACVDDLTTRIPTVQLFVTGVDVAIANLVVEVNGKAIEPKRWGRPYPVDPGLVRITGRGTEQTLSPMEITIAEKTRQPVHILIPLPVKREVHTPTLLQGLGIAFGTVSIAGFATAGHLANSRITGGAVAFGLGGAVFLGLGATCFGVGYRAHLAEKRAKPQVALVPATNGLGVIGRF